MNYLEAYKQELSKQKAVKNGLESDLTYYSFLKFKDYFVKKLLPTLIEGSLKNNLVDGKFGLRMLGSDTRHDVYLRDNSSIPLCKEVIREEFIEYLKSLRINMRYVGKDIYCSMSIENMINCYYESLQEMEYEESTNLAR